MDNKMKELYEKKLADLKLSDIEDDEKMKNVLNKFSEDNLLLPEAWDILLKIEEKRNYKNYNWTTQNRHDFYCKIYKPILKRALFNFYSEKLFFDEFRNPWFRTLFTEEEEPFDRVMNFYGKRLVNNCLANIGLHELQTKLKIFLSYPNSEISSAFQRYRQYSESPMTKDILQMYNKNEKHYEKIEAAKNDLNKWFNAVIEVEEERFIVQNVECKIAENPFNSELWNNYINYLQTKNQEAAAEVYGRYRRLFCDDKSFESTEIDSQNCLNQSQYLENMKFHNISQNRKPEDSKHKNCQLSFSKEIIPNLQTFAFRSTLMYNLIKNASPTIIHKLYQTCKYFFFKIQKPICHSLFVGRKCKYLKHSLTLDEFSLNSTKIKNLWISNFLNFYVVNAQEQPTLLSKFLPKISICDARFLRIWRQNLSLAEYNFLTESKRVEKVIFSGVLISDENDDRISLEQLLYNIPNAYYIEYYVEVRMTEKTENYLSSIKLSHKFGYLGLQFINVVPKRFHHEVFINFLKKYVKMFRYRFVETDEATECLKNAIKKWEEASVPS